MSRLFFPGNSCPKKLILRSSDVGDVTVFDNLHFPFSCLSMDVFRLDLLLYVSSSLYFYASCSAFSHRHINSASAISMCILLFYIFTSSTNVLSDCDIQLFFIVFVLCLNCLTFVFLVSSR